jgi:hypothetical protein
MEGGPITNGYHRSRNKSISPSNDALSSGHGEHQRLGRDIYVLYPMCDAGGDGTLSVVLLLLLRRGCQLVGRERRSFREDGIDSGSSSRIAVWVSLNHFAPNG